MQEKIQRYCQLAEYARKDKSLIPNHSEGRNGIPIILSRELNELKELHELLKNDKDDPEFVTRLSTDIRKIQFALTAYDEIEEENNSSQIRECC